jgi:hypoxanthine phosphoribosyltransferase
MEIIITQEQIQQRVRELANLISAEHEQSGNALPIVMIGLLNGSIHFVSDLNRALSVHCELDFMRLKSYNGQDNSGGIECTKNIELELQGKRVYLVDDICDTGHTITEALIRINDKRPADVRVVTLLRRRDGINLTDHCGFEIGDEWVVGYGLDNNGIQRDLNDIYKLN